MMSPVNDIRAAYEQGRGECSGCSWPTHYGCLGLNLDGLSSHRAHRAAARWQAIADDEIAGDEVTAADEQSLVDMALHLRLGRGAVCLGAGPDGGARVCGRSAVRFCAEALAGEWECAAAWLEEVEADARWARKEAQAAVRAAEDEDWEQALRHARQACWIESGYDDSRRWMRLQWAIEMASR